jgi:hypothetical protein
MSGGSGFATITGATATAIAAWCGAPGTITTITTDIITGTIITTAGTIIIASAGAPLCHECGVMVLRRVFQTEGPPTS